MPNTLAALERSLTNVRPSPEAIARIEEFRATAKALAEDLFGLVPESRERSLAITHLEETVMWGVKAICLYDPDAQEIPIGEA